MRRNSDIERIISFVTVSFQPFRWKSFSISPCWNAAQLLNQTKTLFCNRFVAPSWVAPQLQIQDEERQQVERREVEARKKEAAAFAKQEAAKDRMLRDEQARNDQVPYVYRQTFALLSTPAELPRSGYSPTPPSHSQPVVADEKLVLTGSIRDFFKNISLSNLEKTM